MNIPGKAIQTELLTIFAIPRSIVMVFFGFMLAGMGVAVFIDALSATPFLVLSDIAGMLIAGSLLVLTLRHRLDGNTALVLCVLVAISLFAIGAVSSFFINPQRQDADFILSALFMIVISGMLGFFVHKHLAAMMGGLSFLYVLVAGLCLRTPFILTNFPLLLLAAAGSTLIGFHYRRKLQELVAELIRGRVQVENSLADLKTAQKRIVTQEKLATLGTLVAGISHELRNPLNFINNFSEITGDLMMVFSTQLKPHLEGLPPATRQNLESLMNEISRNLKDIGDHGMRGTAIIQSMLTHNRGQESAAVPTDFNELVRQGSGLALQGYRAREHFYNLNLAYDLDSRIGEVLVIPHEINRVVLNLCSNAFYETHRRSLVEPGPDFVPLVRIQTTLQRDSPNGETLVLTISDNGSGIPEDCMDKIFLPFFTSKPTGEGTGLGLSMAWEIVTAGHDGTIVAANLPEGGAIFTITLPVRRLDSVPAGKGNEGNESSPGMESRGSGP